MEDYIHKSLSKLVEQIILLPQPKKDKLELSMDIDHICYITVGDTTSGRYMIKIPIFGSDTLEEWIIFMHGKGPECDTNAEFLQQTNLVSCCTVPT